MKYYIKAIKNYAVFEGRATRMEFWMFMLFYILVALGIGFVLGIVMTLAEYNESEIDHVSSVVSNIYILFMVLPSISLCVRRLHDINLSGWYYLISLIPLIGIIYLFIIALVDGTLGDNKYGDDPKNRVVNFSESDIVQ